METSTFDYFHGGKLTLTTHLIKPYAPGRHQRSTTGSFETYPLILAVHSLMGLVR